MFNKFSFLGEIISISIVTGASILKLFQNFIMKRKDEVRSQIMLCITTIGKDMIPGVSIMGGKAIKARNMQV